MENQILSAESIKRSFDVARHLLRTQGENDESFASRNYGDGNLDRFRARLLAIGFSGREKVLDLGCGYGQWSIVASEMNQQVLGLDIDPGRISFCKEIASELGVGNLSFEQGDLKSLADDEGFDAIFMFSVLPWLPWKEALPMAIKHLAKNGLLYFNANDLGWLLHNIIDNPRLSSDFESRTWALRSIALTDEYERTGNFNQTSPRDSLYIPHERILDLLKTLPVEIVGFGGEGTLSINGIEKPSPFFPSEAYGQTAVYEFLCRKL
jgi:SAM-dependent methyltransferase